MVCKDSCSQRTINSRSEKYDKNNNRNRYKIHLRIQLVADQSIDTKIQVYKSIF